jgi:pyrimidine operon attenuation protein/uracil phosphoribosyltransferase
MQNDPIRQQLLDADGISKALDRMVEEIIDFRKPDAPFAVVGIKSRADILAQRIIGLMTARGLGPVHHGALDTTLYRDDLHQQGGSTVVRTTEVNFDISGKNIILVDDVIQTGRTIRAALDALMHLGRPAAVRLAVLVDRGEREMPICPDVVGVTVESQQRVQLTLAEGGEVEEVVLL